MVKLEEVEDEYFAEDKAGTDEDEWGTDDDSDASSTTSSIADETLYDRLVALRDVIPPKQRRVLTSTLDTTTSWLRSGVVFSGNALWTLSTSLLLVGVPYALSYIDEQQQVEYEREMKLQNSANEVLAPGAQTQSPSDQAKASL